VKSAPTGAIKPIFRWRLYADPEVAPLRRSRYGSIVVIIDNGHINYSRGANVAGFTKVADAMVSYGIM
jgi:hypothetical protein